MEFGFYLLVLFLLLIASTARFL